MPEEPESLVLTFLRRIDRKVDGRAGEARELKGRVGALELQVTGLHGLYASLSGRLDRVEVRLDRIERLFTGPRDP